MKKLGIGSYLNVAAAVFGIAADRLSQLGFRAGNVQYIVHNLESKSDTVGIEQRVTHKSFLRLG